MIRSIRSRLQPAQFRRRCAPRTIAYRPSSSSSHALKIEDSDTFEGEQAEDNAAESKDDDLWGNAYGAGPSREPYTPRRVVEPTRPAGVSESHRKAMSRVEQTLFPATIHPGDIAQLLKYPASSYLPRLGRIEVEALLTHLVRQDEALLAAKLLLYYVREKAQGNLLQGSNIKPKILLRVIKYATQPPGFDPENPNAPTRRTPRGREDIDVVLPLLRALTKARLPRDEQMYSMLLERLCAEGLYDTAAKVYVELVEEWVTEGRVAQGADLESFYDGGGPPREGKDEWELRSGLYKTWWKGIRTWALPGEVLSPHDRLDLWHPRKLKLPERLRKFPYPIPSSPPTVCPHPTMQNLAIILDHLELDPTDFERFERSMRACAILSSTILSRTLPYLPSRLLKEVLLRTPNDPPVYPEGFNPPADAWAYTAYTHIHLAIRSIMLSPPSAPSLFRFMVAYDEAKSNGTALPKLPEQYRYRTAPLNFSSCVCLVTYGMRKLRNAESVRHVVQYMQHAWGSTSQLYNTLFRAADVARAHAIARQTETILFNKTITGPDAPALSAVRSPRRHERIEGQTWDELEGLSAEPTIQSLHAVLQHMVVTNQRDRFLDTVYRLIPYMLFSKRVGLSDIVETEVIADLPEFDGPRPPPNLLTPSLYTLVLSGLRVMEATATARRIYNLALSAEKSWMAEFEPGVHVPDENRLGIDTFTEMVIIWDKEARRLRDTPDALEIDPHFRKDPKTRRQHTRAEAAEMAVWDVYSQARSRYRLPLSLAGGNPNLVGSIRPTEDFFNALLLARAEAWGLRKGTDWSVGFASPHPAAQAEEEDRPTEIREMLTLASDLRAWKIPGSLALDIRLGYRKPIPAEIVAEWGQDRQIKESKVGSQWQPANDWLSPESKMTRPFHQEVETVIGAAQARARAMKRAGIAVRADKEVDTMLWAAQRRAVVDMRTAIEAHAALKADTEVEEDKRIETEARQYSTWLRDIS